jgi:serine/threonine protein kinase
MPEQTSPEMSETRLPAGTRLNGIYEIDRTIASGGMGDVYKGHAIHTGDAVAIKILRAEFAENEAALALFRKEASALHKLQHEAIVQYYLCSVDPTLQRPYLAMEFVEGQSLSQLLKRGPLVFEAVQTLACRLALGLGAAHARGIIHRDVAPDNIIIPDSDVGRAKIIDFGIARSTLLGDGTVIGGGFAGKYNYVSPEQLGLFGGDITPRSDIYSLGLTLVEALTGHPFDMSGSQVQIIEKRRKLPDLGGLDMRIRPLLEKMLQPDPANRPDSMMAVANWFGSGKSPQPGSETISASHDIGDAGGRSGLRAGGKLWLVGSMAATVVLVIAAGVVYYLPPRATTQPPSSVPSHAVVPPASHGAEKLSPAPGVSNAGTARPNTTPAAQPVQSGPTAAPTLSPAAVGTPTALASSADTQEVEKIKQFIANYNGGDCFFIRPVSVGAKTARIEGYGASVAPFETLDRAFTKAIGFDADIGLRQVVPAQCPAISFLQQSRSQDANVPRLEIDATDLHSGQSLKGTIDKYGNRHIELLLISDDGSVYNLSHMLKDSADRKIFNLRMQLTDATQAEPQILMVVATTSPLSSLSITQPVGAATLFSAARAEAARTGQTIGVTAKYFKLR